MKKVLLIFFIFFLGNDFVNAQIGCAVGNTLYTTKQGAKYKTSPSQTISPPCSFVPFGGNCTVQPNTAGILVTAIECPIDESYIFLGMVLLISIIAFKKVDLFYTK